MIKSILQFQEKGVENLEKIFMNYSADMTKIAEMIKGVTDGVVNLGLSMIAEEWEMYDEFLRKNRRIRQDWYIVRKDSTALLTSLGTVVYHKTLFRNKNTGTYEYLLDRVMGMQKHARMTEDAEAKILEEAVQSSYRKGGENVCITEACVSKEAVMKKIHALEFPRNIEKPEEKKVVDYLYIDADEDHISLQFWEKKGDLILNEKQQKNNNAIAKLVYIYEGIENEAPQSKRHRLVNPYYFSRKCEGEANEKFWDEIYEYMDSHYELEKVKKIYLNADGGSWIKAGIRRLGGVTYVLDGYHLEKHLVKLTSHMKDSAGDAREELRRVIRNEKKKDFEALVERLKGYLDSEVGEVRLETSRRYILSNWTAAKLRLRHHGGVKGCSAEGHVSHVLSSRMSSRPLGWSETGMSKMAELRAYYCNGGNMLELVRYQKEVQPKAAGCEEVVYSCGKLIQQEKHHRNELGILAGMPVYSIPYPKVKKIANFKNQIYGL